MKLQKQKRRCKLFYKMCCLSCKEEIKIGDVYFAQGGAKQWHEQCVEKDKVVLDR